MKKNYADKEILEYIMSGESRLINEIMEYLYMKFKPDILRYVNNNNGSSADADDLLQDCLIVLLRSVSNGNYQLQEASLSTYFQAIFRNKWLKNLAKNKSRYQREQHYIVENEFQNVTIEDQLIKAEKNEYSWKVFRNLGQKCQQILEAFYINRLSIEEIQVIFDFESYEAAKQKKYNCLKNIKKGGGLI